VHQHIGGCRDPTVGRGDNGCVVARPDDGRRWLCTICDGAGDDVEFADLRDGALAAGGRVDDGVVDDVPP